MPEGDKIIINGHTFTHGDWVDAKVGGGTFHGLRLFVMNKKYAYLLSNDEYLKGGHDIEKMGFKFAWAFRKKVDGTLSDCVWAVTPGCTKPKDTS